MQAALELTSWHSPSGLFSYSPFQSLLLIFNLSVELVGKTEQFPGIPWNATVFAIVGLVIYLLLLLLVDIDREINGFSTSGT